MEGRASLLCGFVGVNRSLNSFGEMPSDDSVAHLTLAENVKGNFLGTSAATTPRFLAFPSDLSGRSLVLGPPKFQMAEKCSQILAYVQAPPFDKGTVNERPTLEISMTKGGETNFSVASDKAYTVSKEQTYNLGVDGLGLELSTSLNSSYGKNFSKLNDASNSTSITVTTNVSDFDQVLLYQMSYNVWRYPVLCNSEKAQGGDKPSEVIVVIPRDKVPTQIWKPATELAYRPRSEVGMLRSYVEVPNWPEHYDEKKLMFAKQGLNVNLGRSNAHPNVDNNMSNVTLDKNDITNDSDSKNFDVFNTLSNNLTWSSKTGLFESLPINFGLNLETSTTDSLSEIETTSFSIQKTLSVAVTSGSVIHAHHAYSFTPIIYQHGKLGCLMLTWDVTLHGEGWKVGSPDEDGSVTSPQLCLLRLKTTTENKVLGAFSRSISFKDNLDGTVDIEVEIFNNGATAAEDVSCEFFSGQLGVDNKTKDLILPRIELQLFPGVQGADDLPDGKNQVLVAADEAKNLFFRIYDATGKLVVDTSEARLAQGRADQEIEESTRGRSTRELDPRKLDPRKGNPRTPTRTREKRGRNPRTPRRSRKKRGRNSGTPRRSRKKSRTRSSRKWHQSSITLCPPRNSAR